uniref:Ankyrin repeat domain-containing protein n=1 Tax=Acidobacterium capsulatum TaxID=33075 RepID=A0A7V5CTW4_9BACT
MTHPVAVFEMMQRGHVEALAAALADHAQIVEARNEQGVSLLRMAIYLRQPAMRDLLLPYFPEPDIFDAASLGDTARIDQLFVQDPSLLAAYSGDGWTPLHLAAAFGGAAAVEWLLAHGADVHARSHNRLANQPLHACVAMGGGADALRALLNGGADGNATQQGGVTALHLAAANGDEEAVRVLLASGASKTARSDEGKLPAEYARERSHAAVAALLA